MWFPDGTGTQFQLNWIAIALVIPSFQSHSNIPERYKNPVQDGTDSSSPYQAFRSVSELGIKSIEVVRGDYLSTHNSCEQCKAIDGKIYRLDNEPELPYTS